MSAQYGCKCSGEEKLKDNFCRRLTVVTSILHESRTIRNEVPSKKERVNKNFPVGKKMFPERRTGAGKRLTLVTMAKLR